MTHGLTGSGISETSSNYEDRLVFCTSLNDWVRIEARAPYSDLTPEMARRLADDLVLYAREAETYKTPIDKICVERYGYSRREHQSKDLVTVPVAMLEEAVSSIPPGGDAQALITHLLTDGERSHAK